MAGFDAKLRFVRTIVLCLILITCCAGERAVRSYSQEAWATRVNCPPRPE